MRRILFRWRGFTVWSYPAMLYVGLVVGVVAGNLMAHAAGIDAFRTYVATIILIVPALAGSRLLYVVTNWSHYRHNVARIWDRNDGGAAMFGGFALAVALSVPLLSAMQLSWGGFWDVAI